ncbi:MAG: hypothetical protein GYA71_09820 [Bacteroidales bacterium]|jgi:hypothetical protein|nr:hypothetical protein [Bacteroidales bacterium]
MERFTSFFILMLISLIVLAGCTQSSYRDKELINAFQEGNLKFNEIFGNINEHPDNISALKTDGQNLATEARTQYDNVTNITPISPDLELAKQYYLNAMEEFEKAGLSIVEGVEINNTSGNTTLIKIRFHNASQSMADGARNISNITNALPDRFRARTQNVTPLRTLAPRLSMKVSDNASSPLADYEFIIFDNPVQNSI